MRIKITGNKEEIEKIRRVLGSSDHLRTQKKGLVKRAPIRDYEGEYQQSLWYEISDKGGNK